MDNNDPLKELRDSLALIHGDLAVKMAQFARPRIPPIEQIALPKPLTPSERFDSARAFIDDIKSAINEWRDSDPQNETAPVSLVMADGRYLFVTNLDPLGFHGFIAKGIVDGAPCVVTGHINTLALVGIVLSRAHEMGYTAKARETKTL